MKKYKVQMVHRFLGTVEEDYVDDMIFLIQNPKQKNMPAICKAASLKEQK